MDLFPSRIASDEITRGCLVLEGSREGLYALGVLDYLMQYFGQAG